MRRKTTGRRRRSSMPTRPPEARLANLQAAAAGMFESIDKCCIMCLLRPPRHPRLQLLPPQRLLLHRLPRSPAPRLLPPLPPPSRSSLVAVYICPLRMSVMTTYYMSTLDILETHLFSLLSISKDNDVLAFHTGRYNGSARLWGLSVIAEQRLRLTHCPPAISPFSNRIKVLPNFRSLNHPCASPSNISTYARPLAHRGCSPIQAYRRILFLYEYPQLPDGRMPHDAFPDMWQDLAYPV